MRFGTSVYMAPRVPTATSIADCRAGAISSGFTGRVEQSTVGAVSRQAADWAGVGDGAGVGVGMGTGEPPPGSLGVAELPPQPARARRARERAATGRDALAT
jgi:hypothetical protein